ncbi:nitroreductase family protein, partial [Frankia torreyi]
VEPEVLTDCLRIAQQAPAAGMLRSNLRWIVVRDQALREKIAAPIREVGRESQAKYGHLVDARTLASGKHLLDTLHRVPVLVVPCMQGRPAGDNGELSAFYGSVYPAIWSFQLALRARGLGSTMVGYHLIGREQEVAGILGIPADVTQISMLAVAYTTTDTFHPAVWPPVEDITYHDGWGHLA